MESLPGGTVTFLLTDVEGSTRLHDERPDAARLLADHLKTLAEAVTEHGGVVFATAGDGLAAAFRTAGAAVAAAADGQAGLADWPMRIRMGLHTGEVEPTGDDYQSPVLNRAARVMAAAHGGQVIASEATVALLGRGAAGRVVRDLGSHRLRDVAEPMRLYQVDPPGSSPRQFPPLRTLDRIIGNLPRPVSTFIGREQEVEDLAAVVRSNRVVTVTGPGGVGKTRLALEAASLVGSEFPGGVWLVELASVGDGEQVASAVASLFELRTLGMSPADAVADQLATAPALLVLDNCEHVIDGVADLVEVLVKRAPSLHMLATSREAIGADGERVVPLRPMAIAAAVMLLSERAQALDPSFELGSERALAGELVTRLDGIPLAIELAAARTTTMSVAELVDHLDVRLKLLTGGRRRKVERHATMRATLDWSHDLLTADEQRLFRRLGVFPMSFTLDAMIGVESAVELDAVVEAGDVLDSLVRKSLVQALPIKRAHRQFRLLETVRAYALERLAAAGETDIVARGHADWILASYVRMGLPDSIATRTIEQMHQLVDLRPDVRAAIESCLARGDVQRAVGLAVPHPELPSVVSDGAEWADLVLGSGQALPDAHRFELHVLAANGKMLHAVHPSVGYPDLDAAGRIGPSGPGQQRMLDVTRASQSWFRDHDPDPLVAIANAETAPHPAENVILHYNAAFLLGLAYRDPESQFERGDLLAASCDRESVPRAIALASVARWRARQGHEAVPLFLEAMALARKYPPGAVRSIVVGVAAGGLAALDPAAAREVLLEFIDLDTGDLISPSDIVRAAIGTVVYLHALGRPAEATDLLGRTLALPGASRLVTVYAPDLDTQVALIPGTHRELLERTHGLLTAEPQTDR